MRKNNLNKLLGLALLIVSLAACNTAEQDVEPIISPDNYPLPTFTASSTSSNLSEGNALTYTITLDKPIDRSITFTPVITGGTAGEDDYIAEPAVIAPYSKTTTLTIEAVEDDFPEASETLEFKVEISSLGEKYLVNPSTTFPSGSLTIVNVNDPTLLTIGFDWDDDHKDIDIVTWSNTATYPLTEWGDHGASSSKPEVDNAIWLADPVGDYYVNIMDWGEAPFSYKFSIGHPNGTVQFIEGTFSDDYSLYTRDNWTAWGGSYATYRVLKVVHNGTSFTVTKL